MAKRVVSDQDFENLVKLLNVLAINKVAITAPATGATLTIADGATLTASANATVSGTNSGDNAVNTNANAYADSLVVGLWDDRGSYDASPNTYPASGGSGTAGAVLKGDIWTISVAGTLGGVAVGIGDTVRALVDTPAQTASNWSVLENNIGYVPANVANPLSQFASTTSAQLAGVISDETGSGLLVFNNSPTLITPALGTPSALVATNATGTASGLTAGLVTDIGNLTGEITSTNRATVANKTIITNKTLVTAVGADHVLIADASDSDNLKKVLVSDFTSGGGKRFSATIGDGASTTITTAHGLSIGTGDGVVAVKEIATDKIVDAETKLDGTNVIVIFAVAPASNTYRVTVIA